MKTLIIIVLTLTLSLQAESLSNKNYGSIIVDEVTSVYDGATFRANIKSYPDLLGYRIGIRVNGIDTPEMRGQCQQEKDLARLAKQYTVKALGNAKKIELRNMRRGKYFRIVADVYVDGKNLTVGLIKKKLGDKYDGSRASKDWCASSNKELTVTVRDSKQKYLENKEVLNRIVYQQFKRLVPVNLPRGRKWIARNVIEFSIHHNGDISGLKIINGSGKEILDDTSLQAIEYSYHRFPLPSKKTKIVIEFDYNIK